MSPTNHADWQSRTELLIGQANLNKLRNAHILVVGLGGVGGYACEALVRAGIGNLTIVDGDKIHPSNLNRQLAALNSTLGMKKAEVLAGRLLDINPEINITTIPEYIKDQRMIDILQSHPFDYVIDAIDTLSPKIYLIFHSLKNNLKIVSSMGAGSKLDPTLIRVADISETHSCKLASIVRKRLHKLGIYSGFKAVFSVEESQKECFVVTDNEPNKKTTVGVVSYMPAVYGFTVASVVIRELIEVK